MRKRKKSLYDIAMEKKLNKNLEKNTSSSEKSSIIKLLVIIVKKILIFCFWIIISILVTIGTTIMLNEALRLDFIEKVKISLGI